MHLCDIFVNRDVGFVAELVMCLGTVVSYGGMLIIGCILGMFLVSIGNFIMVLIGVIFYGGLILEDLVCVYVIITLLRMYVFVKSNVVVCAVAYSLIIFWRVLVVCAGVMHMW